MTNVRSSYIGLDVEKKISSLFSLFYLMLNEQATSKSKWRADSLHIGSDVLGYLSL